MDKMLADFRRFCRNEDNRLMNYWEECKNLSSANLRQSWIVNVFLVGNQLNELLTHRRGWWRLGCKKCLNVRQKLGTRNVLMFKCSEQLLFSCVSSKVSICNYVTCRMSHVTCHMLYVKCLCWSLGHAEQFLFSSLGSKVAVYRRKLQCFFSWEPALWHLN